MSSEGRGDVHTCRRKSLGLKELVCADSTDRVPKYSLKISGYDFSIICAKTTATAGLRDSALSYQDSSYIANQVGGNSFIRFSRSTHNFFAIRWAVVLARQIHAGEQPWHPVVEYDGENGPASRQNPEQITSTLGDFTACLIKG